MQEIQEKNTSESPKHKKRRTGYFRFLIDLIETILLAVVLFFGINAISARIRVDGHSMEPTFGSGEFVIVYRLAYRFNEPRQGDIVVFHLPRNPSQDYIKRVIGIPGDEIVMREGHLFVNGEEVREPYIMEAARYEGSWVVKEDELFVLGDNRNNSSDSHSWGPVPTNFIIGKAVFVYWPPTEWGVISRPNVAIAAP